MRTAVLIPLALSALLSPGGAGAYAPHRTNSPSSSSSSSSEDVFDGVDGGEPPRTDMSAPRSPDDGHGGGCGGYGGGSSVTGSFNGHGSVGDFCDASSIGHASTVGGGESVSTTRVRNTSSSSSSPSSKSKKKLKGAKKVSGRVRNLLKLSSQRRTSHQLEAVDEDDDDGGMMWGAERAAAEAAAAASTALVVSNGGGDVGGDSGGHTGFSFESYDGGDEAEDERDDDSAGGDDGDDGDDNDGERYYDGAPVLSDEHEMPEQQGGADAAASAGADANVHAGADNALGDAAENDDAASTSSSDDNDDDDDDDDGPPPIPRTLSVQSAVLSDIEALEVALEMSRTGSSALRCHWQYATYAMALRRLLGRHVLRAERRRKRAMERRRRREERERELMLRWNRSRGRRGREVDPAEDEDGEIGDEEGRKTTLEALMEDLWRRKSANEDRSALIRWIDDTLDLLDNDKKGHGPANGADLASPARGGGGRGEGGAMAGFSPAEEEWALYEMWINEVLRFLAMKVLVGEDGFEEDEDDGNTDGGDGNGDGVKDENKDDAGRKSRRGGPMKMRLLPSPSILDGWKALMLLPRLYAEVCGAMGCSKTDLRNGFAVVHYVDAEDLLMTSPGGTAAAAAVEEGDNDAEGSGDGEEIDLRRWREECYAWTLQGYRTLYKSSPPRAFWPRDGAWDDFDDDHRDDDNTSGGLAETLVGEGANANANASARAAGISSSSERYRTALLREPSPSYSSVAARVGAEVSEGIGEVARAVGLVGGGGEGYDYDDQTTLHDGRSGGRGGRSGRSIESIGTRSSVRGGRRGGRSALLAGCFYPSAAASSACSVGGSPAGGTWYLCGGDDDTGTYTGDGTGTYGTRTYNTYGDDDTLESGSLCADPPTPKHGSRSGGGGGVSSSSRNSGGDNGTGGDRGGRGDRVGVRIRLSRGCGSPSSIAEEEEGSAAADYACHGMSTRRHQQQQQQPSASAPPGLSRKRSLVDEDRSLPSLEPSLAEERR
uniref:Uncharacterized protein n=1 Tax=Odontella aurita TaxID=265563 RepID=A0A7S4K477_9STRA